jgi:hypothetical protein
LVAPREDEGQFSENIDVPSPTASPHSSATTRSPGISTPGTNAYYVFTTAPYSPPVLESETSPPNTDVSTLPPTMDAATAAPSSADTTDEPDFDPTAAITDVPTLVDDAPVMDAETRSPTTRAPMLMPTIHPTLNPTCHTPSSTDNTDVPILDAKLDTPVATSNPTTRFPTFMPSYTASMAATDADTATWATGTESPTLLATLTEAPSEDISSDVACKSNMGSFFLHPENETFSTFDYALDVLSFDYELETLPGVAAGEILPILERAFVDSILPLLFPTECTGQRKRAARLLQGASFVGVSAVPDDEILENSEFCGFCSKALFRDKACSLNLFSMCSIAFSGMRLDYRYQ